MKKQMAFFLTLFLVSAPSYVVLANSDLGAWAQGTSLIGTTDVFYSIPFLARFTQWFIGVAGVLGFLGFFFSFLCSVVVLSNKELFWTIDALKRDSDGSSENKRGPLNGLIEKFKAGSSKDGINGGADQIVIFVLVLFPNFKAYSVYKNIEVDSGGGAEGGSKGFKYAYSDSIGTFFLKSLPNMIISSFVLAISISGILLSSIFTVADIFIVNAHRFTQLNLVAMVDSLFGTMGLYDFNLNPSNTPDGAIAETIARHAMANIAREFPAITNEQAQALGTVIESRVRTDFLGGYGAGQPEAIRRMATLVRETTADGSTMPEVDTIVGTPTMWNQMSLNGTPTINNNPSGGRPIPGGGLLGSHHTINLQELLEQANLGTNPQLTSSFLHFNLQWNYHAGDGAFHTTQQGGTQ